MASGRIKRFCVCATRFHNLYSFTKHRNKGKITCISSGGVVGYSAVCSCGEEFIEFKGLIGHISSCDSISGLDALAIFPPGKIAEGVLDSAGVERAESAENAAGGSLRSSTFDDSVTVDIGGGVVNRDRLAFFIHCACGEEFDSNLDYVKHRKGTFLGCKDSPVFAESARGSLSVFSKELMTSERRLSAFFGDLDHKREVVNKYNVLGQSVSSFFDGKHMAWYIKSFASELIDSPLDGVPPSVHTLATIFEYYFHVSVAFRFKYMRWLPNKLAMAPMVDADGSVPRLGECVENATNAGILTGVSVADTTGVSAGAYGGGANLPIAQLNPPQAYVPGDPNVIFDWANSERYWRFYPELMGYNRQVADRTSGDYFPFFLSAKADGTGRGTIGVDFPGVRSPFDNEENGSQGQLDGLSHWKHEHNHLGYRVAIWILSPMAHFTDPLYNGTFNVEEIDKREANYVGLRVEFAGPAKHRVYMAVQRFVVWSDGRDDDGPRPESPGPRPIHDDL